MAPADISRRNFLLPWRRRSLQPSAEPLLPVADPPALDAPRMPRKALLPLAILTERPRCEAQDPALVRPLGEVPAGSARIDPELCTAYRGLPCRICFEVCPVPDVLALAPGLHAYVPVAGPQPCAGCGDCQKHCRSEGAIRIIALQGGAPDRVRVSVAPTDAP